MLVVDKGIGVDTGNTPEIVEDNATVKECTFRNGHRKVTNVCLYIATPLPAALCIFYLSITAITDRAAEGVWVDGRWCPKFRPCNVIDSVATELSFLLTEVIVFNHLFWSAMVEFNHPTHLEAEGCEQIGVAILRSAILRRGLEGGCGVGCFAVIQREGGHSS